MTTQDRVCLADLGMTLSEPVPGQSVGRLILPGELKGRNVDRHFKCTILAAGTRWSGRAAEWSDYVKEAVDYVDFVEISSKGFSDQP